MPGISESPRFSIDEDSSPHVEEVHGFGGNFFNPSWTSKPTSKKVKKVLGPGSSTKAQQTNTSPTHEPLIVGSQKLGTWTRISRPHTFFNGKGHPEKDGPKRTTNQAGMEDELSVKEKMLKLDEEARQLGVLLESEFR
nr:hypothetical protein CFP56_74008 [Quercus suber]